MTAVTTGPSPDPANPPTGPDKAAKAVLARQHLRYAAARWLTPSTTTALGRQVAESVDRYLDRYQRGPTWAEALAGVDPALLQPLRTVPEGWPLRPALWRLQLRERLMEELKRTRWITYTKTPRSLRPSEQGRGWLTNTTPADTGSAAAAPGS